MVVLESEERSGDLGRIGLLRRMQPISGVVILAGNNKVPACYFLMPFPGLLDGANLLKCLSLHMFYALGVYQMWQMS
jgi:hypothetical protein